MKKIDEKVKTLLVKKVLNPAKTWIAKKWFNGDENLMLGFFGIGSVLLVLVVFYFMTNPSDALIQFVQHVFQYFGWW